MAKECHYPPAGILGNDTDKGNLLTIARDILSTMWAMWRNGEKYNPDIDKKVKT